MILSIITKKNIENFSGGGQLDNSMLNIYDEPLENCGDEKMNNGSWDENKKCSELGGGVHQICVKEIANNLKNFSKITGQSNWSDNRGKNNHCICLGAWSLYNKKLYGKLKGKRVLKCEAIPKASLSDNYVSKFSEGWNKWNGLELNNQIKEGVNGLIENCYDSREKKSEKLKRNYCNFSKDIKVLRESKTYEKLCSNN